MKAEELIHNNKSFRGYIGIAETIVTPPIGIYARSWGAAVHDQPEGKDGELKAVAISFSNSRTATIPQIIISADFGIWRGADVRDEIIQYLLKEFNVPTENLLLCFTHTHAGPVLSNDEAGKPGAELIKPYLFFLKMQLRELVQNCIANATLAIVDWSYGKCSLATNRDFFIDGEERFLTGFNPAVEADDTLLVGKIYDEQKNAIKGIIVNYACHPTTLAWQNKLLSADYVGAMRETVEKELHCPVLFIQGASENLLQNYNIQTA